MYSVFLKPKAKKYLDKVVDAKYREKIKEAIKFLAIEPVPFRVYGLKKVEGLEDNYRIRIGKYRFIYAIFHNENSIVVTKIDKRDENTYNWSG